MATKKGGKVSIYKYTVQVHTYTSISVTACVLLRTGCGMVASPHTTLTCNLVSRRNSQSDTCGFIRFTFSCSINKDIFFLPSVVQIGKIILSHHQARKPFGFYDLYDQCDSDKREILYNSIVKRERNIGVHQ